MQTVCNNNWVPRLAAFKRLATKSGSNFEALKRFVTLSGSRCIPVVPLFRIAVCPYFVFLFIFINT